MDLFFINYTQTKKERKSSNYSKINLKLYLENNILIISTSVSSSYNRASILKHITFEHKLELNLSSGDFFVTYGIINDDERMTGIFKNTRKIKKNDFKLLENFTEYGLMKGEKKNNYWGVKYRKELDKVFYKLKNIFDNHFYDQYYVNKNYKNKFFINSFYDLIVDFHLDRKNIKGYDDVYNTIQNNYPKKKWLKQNNNKFLPSILDEYGIKSKYIISKLNNCGNGYVNIKTVKYVCKLFGENYIDYIRNFDWIPVCMDDVPNNRIHQLKNDSEKKIIIKLINSWFNDNSAVESFVGLLNQILTLRDDLEKIGYELKFNSKSYNEFIHLLETWKSLKIYLNRGYKLKYQFPIDFKNEIEKNVVIGKNIYEIKILESEDDFRLEGFFMKNCMSNQFSNGLVFIYISMEYKKQKINLQYKNGNLINSYGKANTPVPLDFKESITILNSRIKKYSEITWIKEKYDFI